MLDHLLLIACLCIIISSIFYFFYLNRVIAWILGILFRFMYWRQGATSVWIQIGSIHFSIITGRILLKDVRYHSSNQTIKIVKAQVAWRYWIRKPMMEEDLVSAFAGSDNALRSVPSCRLQITLQGFEWFLYNRTAAYDNIITQMQAKNPPSTPPSRRPSFQKGNPMPTPSVLLRRHTPMSLQNAVSWIRRQLPSFDPKDILPLGIEVLKGAIICGNDSTPNLLVAEFKRTEGTFGTTQSRSKYDFYKNILNLSFQNALIRYVANDNYRNPMIISGEIIQERLEKRSRQESYLSFHTFGKLWRQLRLYPLINSQVPATVFHGYARGERKSVEEEALPGTDFAAFEYAIERKILEAPVLELTYYADVVGIVPPSAAHTDYRRTHLGVIDNGDIDPEWGIDLVVKNGVLRYGPWADRQRAELQKTFFPPTYQDATETLNLEPGDQRMWTDMRVFIELRNETMLHVPFREASKDWQWDGLCEDTHLLHLPKKRECAWMHLTVGDSSSINYVMPMVAGPNGYEPTLEVHLDTVCAASSLNDIRLVTAESCRVRCELPSPLKWNAERKWNVSVTFRQSVLYLLRDHINMFTDLGKDWASGPPSDFHRFVPTIYEIELDFYHYALNLYANDHNIIDKPRVREDNTLFTLRGPRIKTAVTISSNKFQPNSTTIPLTVDAPEVALNLSLPRWNTNALHLPKEGNNIAKLGNIRIAGSYLYFADVHPENVEQFKLSFTGRDVTFKLLGWAIRYIMVLRDNYIGSFTHFSTLTEYLARRRDGIPPGDPVVQKYRPGKSNMLQVEMSVCVTNGAIVMPAGLPGYEHSCTRGSEELSDETVYIGPCLVLTLSELQVQLRLHDYYMELSVNSDPISGRIEENCPEQMIANRKWGRPKLMIDGLDITANRLFGPVPRTITYVCVWEIHIGHVRGVFSASEGHLLIAAGKSFGFNFTDLPNAPADDFMPQVFPDLTFLKLSIDAIDVTWKAGSAALVVTFPEGFGLDSNDLGGRLYKKLTSVRCPQGSFKALLAPSENNQTLWFEVAEFMFDAYLDLYSAPAGWRDQAGDQAKFVHEQDESTGRAARLLSLLGSGHVAASGMNHADGVYLPQLTPSDHGRPPRIQGHEPRISVKDQKPQQWSDSDGEIGVSLSEIDRDARVARRRSETPLPVKSKDDDRDMSSGDESDDEDLTEDHWGSDDLSDLEDNNMLLQQYSRFVRHFKSSDLNAPASWAHRPFFLIRDIKSQHSTPSPSDRRPSQTKPHVSTASSRSNSGVNVLRLLCRNGINIRVTPLLVLAIQCLKEDLERVNLSPEFLLDAMISRYVSDFSGEKDERSTITFDIVWPSAMLQFLHLVTPSPKDQLLSLSPSASLESVGEILQLNLGFDGAHILGTFSDEHLSISCRIDRVSADLTATEALPRPTLAGLVFEQLSFDLERTSATLKWEGITSEMGHIGPRYLASFVVSVIETANQLRMLYQSWARRARVSDQNVIHSILRYSSGKEENVDPLSAVQPSYLVQSGIPYSLRTDLALRFIFHLRDCLWHLRRRAEHSMLQRGPATIEQLKLLLEARLRALEGDDYDPGQLLVALGSLLPAISPEPESTASPKYTMDHMSVEVKLLRISVLDPSGSASTNLTLADLVSTVRIRRVGLESRVAALSQTSLPPKSIEATQIVSASIIFGSVTLTLYPHLMGFAQQVLRVSRSFGNQETLTFEAIASPKKSVSVTTHIDFLLCVSQLRVRAVAEKLISEFGISQAKISSSSLLHEVDRSMHLVVLFDDMFLRARSPIKPSVEHDQDILASFNIRGGKTTSAMRQEIQSHLTIGMVWSFNAVHLRVPRSAIRLYRFVQEWRADFLPGIEAMVHELLSEVQNVPKPLSVPVPQLKDSRKPVINMRLQVASLGVYLQVMHGTWLTAELTDTTSYFNSSLLAPYTDSQIFGIQSSSFIFCIIAGANGHNDAPASRNTRVKLKLPPISLSGSFDGCRVRTIVLVEFLKLKVKPSHWDTILSVQQKFGQDFNDLVALVDETRRRTTPPVTSKANNMRNQLQTVIFLKMKGFRVGLEGLSSTLFLECRDIDGRINDNHAGRSWSIVLCDLALSLASGVSTTLQSYPMRFNQSHRSAFIIIDFKVNGEARISENALPSGVLQMAVTRIHAVMQPSSIGEFGDLIDYIQAEMLERKEQRAQDLASFKERTQSILKTFESHSSDTAEAEKSSWITQYDIDISMSNVGVAFPLIHGRELELELPRSNNDDDSAVRAFLLSINYFKFRTQRGETGQVSMENLSLQFVPHFRQSLSRDFAGETHVTRNRLVYPSMTAQLRSSSSTVSRQLFMRASVSGFIIDLDSSIPNYVFSLIDVYRRGKERVAQLATNLPRKTVDPALGSLEKQYTALPTSNIFASFTFLSGKVRMYGAAVSELAARLSSHDLTDEQLADMDVEIFNLPIVSVWAEYRATPASQKISSRQEIEPSILMFKSTVHSSHNTLRPSLLFFLNEIVLHVENRMRRAVHSSQPPSVLDTNVISSTVPVPNTNIETDSSMQISFSLRIDQSKLELTCQPDVNVIAGLHWDSGGFMVNVFPGARNVAFTGSVGGLTVGLKHGFLSEDCVKLDARNLCFSIAFAKMSLKPHDSVSSVSVTLDTELLGSVRFSRLQDILCFKAVWLDRIPVFNGHASDPPKSVPKPNSNSPSLSTSGQREFTTLILVRIRHIGLDVDLGQSIGTVSLDLQESVLRTRLTETVSEVSISVGDVVLGAKGNLAGHARVSDCVFQTTRLMKTSILDSNHKKRMLELRLTSGPLIATLESDQQKLVHYRAEPMEIEIFDDWSMISPQDDHDRPLELSFTVNSPEIVALVTVSTLPKLMLQANKFQANLESQREGASRESDTFRATRTPKPDNPVSAVAETMLHSARTRLKGAEKLVDRIRQHMSLRLNLLRLVVFPRSMADIEVAQFLGRNVRARLTRLAETAGTPLQRDIHLSFSSMVISRFTQLGKAPSLTTNIFDGNEGLEALLKDASEANIVGLPSMVMRMVSQEEVEENRRVLTYDFHSRFIHHQEAEDLEEDIYITLNLGQYTWLTNLRKSLTREMGQAKLASEWRSSLNATSAATRRKVPEPLNIPDSPKTAALPPKTSGNPVGPSSRSASATVSSFREQPPVASQALPRAAMSPTFASTQESEEVSSVTTVAGSIPKSKGNEITYRPRDRRIERLNMRQLGEATPDVMHPFFMKKAGFSLEDSLPQYVSEYATAPLEEIMEALLKLYSKQLLAGRTTS